MEIIFEFENSDIDVVFTSDFVPGNRGDQTKISWNLHDGSHSRNVANVFGRVPKDEDTTAYILPNL